MDQVEQIRLEAFKKALADKLCGLIATGGCLDFSRLTEAERAELQRIIRTVVA